jgi:LacI family transcriptional regulator
MTKLRIVPASAEPSPRSRVLDIARRAGVSTATVDRVINRRGGVKPATVQRVLRVAVELDYLEAGSVATQASAVPMQVVFVLPSGVNRWMELLGDYVGRVETQMVPFNVRCRCVHVEGFNPELLAATLLKHGQRAEGVAFVALDHPLVREAVHHLAEQGVHVLTLASDLSNSRRAAYVGLDNRAAGRTAGLLLGRFLGERRGEVAMIAGSLSYRGHGEREMGFQHILQEVFPHLQLVGLREGHDDARRNHEQARILLARHPDLIGIYNIGGGSDGIARALKDAGRDRTVVFVGHEVTTDTRAYLMDGTIDAVISQNPQLEIMNTIRIFANLREGRGPLAGIEPVRIGVILKENLP